MYEYWYEKEGGALLELEKESYFRFLREFCREGATLRFLFDREHRFCVQIALPVQMEPGEPWRTFHFHVQYQHDHPGRDQSGLFGGSIRIYVMDRLKPGFHHLVKDEEGRKFLCQVRETDSAAVNGYNAMKRVLRWIEVYCIWEKTGRDIDR